MKKQSTLKIQLWKHKYLIAILAITILYAIVAFWNLGSFSAPQTFIPTTEGEEYIIELENPSTISQISLYVGIGQGKLQFAFSKGGVYWSDYEDFELNNSAFTWQIFKKSVECKYIKIRISKTTGEFIMLGEVGVYFEDELLPLATVNELGDEQSYIPKDGNYFNSTYFDEIYHPRTAYEILHDMDIYETTHPPLGKLFIAAGISIFGMTPFGWRFFGTLFGVLMLPAIYLLGTKLFKKKKWLALLAAALFACDFMHFSLTRMATIDSFPVCFMLYSYYFLLCYVDKLKSKQKWFAPLLLSGTLWGLGCASKWIAIYAAFAILFIILLSWAFNIRQVCKTQRLKYIQYSRCRPHGLLKICLSNNFLSKIAAKQFCKLAKLNWKQIALHFSACVLSFVIIPAAIYVASYIPQAIHQINDPTYKMYIRDENGVFVYENGEYLTYKKTFLRIIIESQKYMYGYHASLDATHPYSSSALSWLYDGKPLWAYSHSTSTETAAGISIFSNPLLCWLGVLAMLALLIKSFSKPNFEMIFITFAFLAAYLPWLLVDREIWKTSGRVLFAYHFFASIPFIILALCYWLQEFSWKVSATVFAAILAIFVWFYPAISGVEVKKSYLKTLRWGDHLTYIDKNEKQKKILEWVIYAK